MSGPKDGGPAFPRVGEGFGNPKYDAEGMSLRDYFAGQVLAGFTAGTYWGDLGDEEECAKACYEQADAMIAAREHVK